jgi:hypothetical protein
MPYPARYWLAAFSLVVSGACVRTPDSYPLPQQHNPFLAGGVPASEFLTMDHPDLRKAVVKDVLVDEQGPWRWTGPDPELRFSLSSLRDRTLVVEFVINDRTFRDTGPVTVSFYVNDHLAGQERYTSDGDKSFEKAIPTEWLQGRQETRVHLHVHNVWPTAGGSLGVLLKRMGFAE